MDLCDLARLLYLDQGLAEQLGRGGWTITRLATLHGAEDEALMGMLDWLERECGGAEGVDTGELYDLIKAAHEAAKVSWTAEGAGGSADLYVASMQARREKELTAIRTKKIDEVAKLIPAKGTALRVKWPSCREKRLAAAGADENQRESIEKDERERWVRELVHILRQGGAPVMDEIFVEGADPIPVPTRRFAKGRRAGTLRKHVRTWQRAMRFWQFTFGTHWPQHPYHVVAYLENRAAEPCGRTVPMSIFKTIMFMEHSAEVSRSAMVHLHPSVKNALEEITLELEKAAKEGPKQALHYPVRL